MALLEVRGLRTGYEGIPVVFGIDLDVEEGEVVTVLGANGAGKTTTLRAISGMIGVMAGTVTFAGERISGRPSDRIARKGLLHIPAGRGVFPSLAVTETLRLAAALSGLRGAETERRLGEVYDTFPRLAERATQTAGTLSGGEQQMLALARGLVAQPRLLMVDEMSQGLAPTIVADLFAVLDRFTEQGVAVLLVEQFVGQALALASRAYVLEKGEITFAGPASTLAADEEFVKGSYLGDVSAERVGDGLSGADQQAATPPALVEQLTVSLPPALMRSLQARAEREGVALGDLVRRAVEGTLTPPADAPDNKAEDKAGGRTRRRPVAGNSRAR